MIKRKILTVIRDTYSFQYRQYNIRKTGVQRNDISEFIDTNVIMFVSKD